MKYTYRNELLATNEERLVSARPSATESATSLMIRLERANEVAVIKFTDKAGPIIGRDDLAGQAGQYSQVACMH